MSSSGERPSTPSAIAGAADELVQDRREVDRADVLEVVAERLLARGVCLVSAEVARPNRDRMPGPRPRP